MYRPCLLLAVSLAGCSSTSSTLDGRVLGDAARDRATDSSVVDSAVDSREAAVELELRPPFPEPSDPLTNATPQSCAVFNQQRCGNDGLERCEVYDTAARRFTEPDPLLRRVLLYDRWTDLYHQPDGQTVNRVFNSGVPAGTPEAQWGALERFAEYGGRGDSAIWSGTALVAHALRYLSTGTRADYQRMETKARRLLAHFDVTEIPGYLARYHFLDLPADAPRSDQHLLTYAGEFDYRTHVFDPARVQGLPAVYRDGITDESNQTWHGTPYWRGNPSIDQYSGPLAAFALTWDLLQDESLKQRIARHLTCYLKRLRRIEVRNIQDNAQAIEAVSALFADRGDALQLDPGDIDFRQLDTVVLYVLEQINSANHETFDRACPDRVALQPTRVIDATDRNWLLDLLALASDMAGGEQLRTSGIDHFYIVSIRGADAIHLMHLAALAWRMTGEAQYRSFVVDELIGRLRALEVADTASALIQPRWCRSFYGDHISYTPLWSLLTMLAEGELRTRLQRVLVEEFWSKRMHDLRNVKFNLMLAGEVPATLANERDAALAQALADLEELGGNGGVLDDPRRQYTVDRQWLLDNMPPGNEPLCPTEAQRALCEDGIEVFGMSFPGEKITHPCGRGPGECPLGDGCAWAEARQAMPPRWRPWEDFLWQRNPFKIGVAYSVEGRQQSPGLDLIESYWLARAYGLISTGARQVLAWRAVDAPCP